MSAARQLIPHLRSAVESISDGKYEDGLKSAEAAIQVSPKSQEAIVARAVCLSRLSKQEEADISFEAAAELGPNNEHVHYNYAVHLYRTGRTKEAFDRIKRALAISPNRLESNELYEKLAAELGINLSPQCEPRQKKVYLPVEEVDHALTWLPKLEPAWTWAMFALSVCSVIALLLAAFLRFEHHLPTVLFYTTMVLGYAGNLGGTVMAVFDIADRRTSLFWLVLFVITTVFGLTFVAMALYLMVGRRIPATNEPV